MLFIYELAMELNIYLSYDEVIYFYCHVQVHCSCQQQAL